jgi:hypothetical protein
MRPPDVQATSLKNRPFGATHESVNGAKRTSQQTSGDHDDEVSSPFVGAAIDDGTDWNSALGTSTAKRKPLTPGFWSFANRKSERTRDVVAACRNYIEIHFADGHYIGLRIQKTESGVAVREVGEVGRCTFNRETQVEHCEKRLINSDGSILLGTAESRYSFDDGKTLKMTVTPKMVTDTPLTNAPFDTFPVHCPDDVVWGILNEVGRSR